MKNIFSLAFVVLFFVPVFGQNTIVQKKIISGIVFIDNNNDGKKNGKEKGLKDILVSNGIEIVKTDKQGRYQLNVQSGQTIFPILPSDFTVYNRNNTSVLNANFIQIPNVDAELNINEINIPLIKQIVSNEFTFGAIGDVQVDNSEELEYASKSVFRELANSDKHAFNIFMGDLVNDKMDLMKDVRLQLNLLSTPSFTLVGNHDRNTKNPNNMTDRFNTYLGASTYAFNYGKVHFIVLNNVYSTGKNDYEGRIDSNQLEFIKNDLQYISKSTPIVINQHIPMVGTKNRNDLFQLLEGYKNVLILSGHTHVVSRHFFKSKAIHELGVGATSGTWWRGEKDIYGIPLAMMQCGTPRGYFSVTFNDEDYSFDYKVIGNDEKQQLHLVKDSVNLITNIYGGSDSTLVEIQFNDGPWIKMNKNRIVDPIIADIVQKNKAKIYPTEGSTILPIRGRNSNHIWTIDYRDMNLKEVSKVSIRAKDDYGLNIQQQYLISF